MISVGNLFFAVFVSVTAFGLWKCFQFVFHIFASPLRHLRGPKGTSWIYGNLREVFTTENPMLHEEWTRQYGSTLVFKGLFGSNRLFTVDPQALNHVLAHSSDYQKPFLIRYQLAQTLGKGVIFVEGAQHRQQRRIMNPAFGLAQIRPLTDIFLAKSVRLRDFWLSEIANNPAGATSGTRLNLVPWLHKMTLEVIGHAGFNYNFDALSTKEKLDETQEALRTMNAVGQDLDIFSTLRVLFPPLRLLPSERVRRVQAAQRTVVRVCKELLLDAKAAAQASVTEEGKIEKDSRDILALLVRANMATDIPESQRLSDEDVVAQVLTFLIVGHDTTSVSTTWALHVMAEIPETQTRLREELLSVDTETPSMDQLMALPYLDAVVKETLRLYSAVSTTIRVAMKDDVLPVAKPFTDKNGVVRDSIRIIKGDQVFVPIQTINRSQELWGPDAHEFKPERWENLPEAVLQIPGVWGNQLTFLGGPRACLGHRFSVVEMKSLLFVLLRAFEFEPAVCTGEIGRTAVIIQRPILRSDLESGTRLPLLVKLYQRM